MPVQDFFRNMQSSLQGLFIHNGQFHPGRGSGAPVHAEQWGTNMSRQQALAQLHSANSSERREGLVRLAEAVVGDDDWELDHVPPPRGGGRKL